MIDNEIANPNEISKTEAELFDIIKKNTHELLEALRANGNLKKPTKEQIDNFVKIIELDIIDSNCYNSIVKVFEDKEKAKKIEKEIDNFPNLYIRLIICNFNKFSELFRITFLLILKEKQDTTLGGLINNLKKSNLPKDLIERIDVKLRNSFSHNTYWISNGKLFYCDNASLQNPKEMKISRLMQISKKQNILYQAFLRALAEKSKEGFFISI